MIIEFANKTQTRLSGKTVIIGIGGVGGNTLVMLSQRNDISPQLLFVDTDKKVIEQYPLKNTLLIGESVTHGNSTGGYAKLGEAAALESMDDIIRAIGGAEAVIIIAGLSGGTGGGGSKAVIEALQNKQVLLVAVMPFNFEGSHKKLSADSWLKYHIDAGVEIIVVHNQEIMNTAPKETTLPQAFSMIDAEMVKAINTKLPLS